MWLLGWVSFFTDMASEMVYPLLPLFLTQVLGAGAMSLGVIEGAAEAANSALKIVSGWLADRWRSPKKLVLVGYGIASAVRPLIGLATAWPQVLAIRFSDRLGKGIRGAPRDAMLADFAPADARGRVFGFHRAMDHAGAVTGPLLATAFLYFYPGNYRTLFLLTIIPGIIVILFILRVPERSEPGGQADVRRRRRAEAKARSPVEPGAAVLLRDGGHSAVLAGKCERCVPAAALERPWRQRRLDSAPVVGAPRRQSDFITGRRRALGQVWPPRADRTRLAVVRARLCRLRSFRQEATVIAIFLAYGLYFGLTEGNEKAWVADMAPAHARGTAFGIYNAALGIGSLAASLIFGALWTRVSPHAAFLTGAGLAILASALLFTMFRSEPRA